MRRFSLAGLFLLVAFVTIGCATRSRVIEKSRVFGDTYIIKTVPAPIVQATDDGTPEAVIDTANQKFKGRIYNETGSCSIFYELPPNSFEYRAQVNPGPCTMKRTDGTVANLEVGQELENNGVVYRTDTDLGGHIFCEQWKQTNQVRVPPGLKSPYLRALGGRTYALNTSQSGVSGRIPYNTVFRLNIDAGLTTIYKGDEVDWVIRFVTCYAQ